MKLFRKTWNAAILGTLLIGVIGCKGIKIPPCLLDGTLCQPSPIPSPIPTSAPSPSPAASPTSSPSPQPSISPSPAASPSAAPTPSATPVSACPRPDDVKLGFRAAVKKEIGFRNTFDLTPMFEGQAIRPESGCGEALVRLYGEFERFETSPVWGGGREAVELQSDNPYILVEATNSDETHWNHGHFTQAGERTYCVSYHHLAHYRCQKGQMDDSGRLVGFGQNNRGFDLAK